MKIASQKKFPTLPVAVSVLSGAFFFNPVFGVEMRLENSATWSLGFYTVDKPSTTVINTAVSLSNWKLQ